MGKGLGEQKRPRHPMPGATHNHFLPVRRMTPRDSRRKLAFQLIFL
jgi:hypothetical protein